MDKSINPKQWINQSTLNNGTINQTYTMDQSITPYNGSINQPKTSDQSINPKQMINQSTLKNG